MVRIEAVQRAVFPGYYRSFSGQERANREPGLQEEKLRLLHEAAEGGHPKAQSGWEAPT